MPPPPPNYVLLATKPSNVFTYEDVDYTFGGPFILKYKVTAVVCDESNNVYETSATNVVQASGSFYKETPEKGQSLSTQILNNYPNPFNPATTIKYNLNESGNIKLIVSNPLGEEVKVVESEFKEAGEYSV